jgi:hypothetical protein
MVVRAGAVLQNPKSRTKSNCSSTQGLVCRCVLTILIDLTSLIASSYLLTYMSIVKFHNNNNNNK